MENNNAEYSKLNREDLALLAKHGIVDSSKLQEVLQRDVYSSPTSWSQFIRLILIVLGVGFTVLGVLFFFAYNWQDLHRFAKHGIVGALLILITLLAVGVRTSKVNRQIAMTGASVLVGVLLAVIGQTYQLGADSFELFFAWVICITIWVILTDFYPLWVLYIGLVNISVITYFEEKTAGWAEIEMLGVMFLINALILVFFWFRKDWQRSHQVPSWFIRLLVLTTAFIATACWFKGISETMTTSFLLILGTIIVLYIYGIWNGIATRNSFNLSVIAISVILAIAYWMFNSLEGEYVFLLVSVFIIISISGIIAVLNKWNHSWGD